MITEIVTFKLPEGMTQESVVANFEKVDRQFVKKKLNIACGENSLILAMTDCLESDMVVAIRGNVSHIKGERQ